MNIGNQIVKICFVCLIGFFLSACEWPSYKKIAVSAFADDSEFNTNLESNQRTQLDALNYYSPNTTVVLQCLNSSNGWTTLGNGTLGLNSDGSPINFNTNRLDHPVYGHNWSGTWLLQVAGNCAKTTTPGATLVTTKWSYQHTATAITLRFTDLGGNVQNNYNDSERSCFFADRTLDFWERHGHCNDPANDNSYLQHLDETITRVSNFVDLWFIFNPRLSVINYLYSGKIDGPNDLWQCTMQATVDGVPYGLVASALDVKTQALKVSLKKGQVHTLGVTVVPFDNFGHKCAVYADAYSGPIQRCGGSNNCSNNTVNLMDPRYHPLFAWGKFGVNPFYQGEQSFSFNLK